MRISSTAIQKKKKAAYMTSSGRSIAGSMAGAPKRLTLAGWCSVLHQSTENLTIGRLTAPTSASTAAARPARRGSSKARQSAM